MGRGLSNKGSALVSGIRIGALLKEASDNQPALPLVRQPEGAKEEPGSGALTRICLGLDLGLPALRKRILWLVGL